MVAIGSARRVVFTARKGWGARLRALGVVRLAFVLAFFVFYSLLVFWALFGGDDPYYQFRYEEVKIEQEQGGALDILNDLVATKKVKKIFLTYDPPSSSHWLGTDELGRDVLNRLAHGALASLEMGFICLFSFLVAGIGFGITAGYFEGRWRGLVLYFFSLVNTFPLLLLLLLSVIIIDGLVDDAQVRIYLLMLLLGLFSSPKLAELIRGRIASLKETAFVHAAVSLGLSPVQIIGKHILWYECRPLILVQSAYMMGQAILIETTLTYLKFGLEYPVVSWGLMLRTMASGIFTDQIQVVFVMAMIALSVFFFQYLAALLNDLLATRHKGD